jgi:ribose 5-phosphate isomerase A
MEVPKRNAARAALDELPALSGSVIGLGTGSTARLFVEELACYLKQPGKGHALVCVPTSDATRHLAASLGIPLLDDEGPWDIDVNVDGADEVSDSLDMIKGGGGAHAREKIVNFAARKNVVIVEASKLSVRLGDKRAVPIEVLPFAHRTTRAKLARYGEPTLRLVDDKPARTDAGNLLYDLRIEPAHDPASLDRALRSIPGVVETGLFVGRADVVLVADATGVRRMAKQPTRPPDVPA